MVERFKHVHLIGIGGSGLSAIARVLLQRGVTVSGSDRQDSPLLEQLRAEGARVWVGHRAENIGAAQVVVRSSAVDESNVEVQAARSAGIPVLRREDFLGYLTDASRLIAVAGTHGKTTTTSMLAWVLTALGLDPSYIIGGVSLNLGSNAHAGNGAYFVIEADEYDRMFLGLRPEVAVVTSIEHDHPDCYPSYEEFYAAFRSFADRLRPGGMLIACGEERGARRLLLEWRSRGGLGRSYGLSALGYDTFVRRTRRNAMGGYEAEVVLRDGKVVPLELQVPGEHNLRNALAVVTVADWLHLPLTAVAQALAEFKGTERRFEVHAAPNGVVLVDDYAHHPTEIRATLAAARARFPQRRLWAVWQPHTYSRTRQLFAEFAQAFADADQVVVTAIYAAREAPPADGFSADQVAAEIQRAGKPVFYAADLLAAQKYLAENVRPADVVLVLSAGDANQINRRLLEEWQTAVRN